MAFREVHCKYDGEVLVFDNIEDWDINLEAPDHATVVSQTGEAIAERKGLNRAPDLSSFHVLEADDGETLHVVPQATWG